MNVAVKDTRETGRFAHENNIQVGQGRIMWGNKRFSDEFRPITLEEGWVLPGGARTQDRAIAIAAAASLHRHMTLSSNG